MNIIFDCSEINLNKSKINFFSVRIHFYACKLTLFLFFSAGKKTFKNVNKKQIIILKAETAKEDVGAEVELWVSRDCQ